MKHISKQAFLGLMRTRYAPFDEFLQNLEKGLLTTPGVNDDWSVKDHLAHLAFWEQQTLTKLQYIREHGEEPVDQFEGLYRPRKKAGRALQRYLPFPLPRSSALDIRTTKEGNMR